MAGHSRFRIILQAVDTAAGRGPGAVVAMIEDAKDIGASEQVNGPGEMFFTLAQTHPQVGEIQPLQTHYKIQRKDNNGDFVTKFAGLVDDYESTPDEVVFYGRDYLSLLDTSITAANASYSSRYVGQIVQGSLTNARNESNSRVNFISMGTIENTATTTVALTSYQSRLEFISQVADIAMADNTVRAVLQVAPRSSDTPSFNFTANQGSDREGVRLEYGGLVNDYLYSPGYSTLRTSVRAIGQKREGASLLFSTQTTTLAPITTYGSIAEPVLFIDIIDQSALDKKAARAARQFARVGKTLGLSITSGRLGPWEGFDLADSVRVIIRNGIDNVNALYTVWGVEWIGRKNGSEEMVLSLLPKDE